MPACFNRCYKLQGEFIRSCHNYPLLLHPAYVIQQCIRERLMGREWWQTRIDKRAAAAAAQGPQNIYGELIHYSLFVFSASAYKPLSSLLGKSKKRS
jgi:hypothetical protein